MSASAQIPYSAKPFQRSEKNPPSSRSPQALLEAQLRNSTLRRGECPWRLATAYSSAPATVKTEQVGRPPCRRGVKPIWSRAGRRSTAGAASGAAAGELGEAGAATLGAVRRGSRNRKA